MYSESTLSEIRNRLNIVELVGEYVQLKKSGQGYMGLCPFHNEKSPSFHVHPIKQCFHCFGCQKGGNVFTFLCAIEGVNFPESVQRLAKRTGVTLEETSFRKEKRAESPVNLRLLEAHEWAAKYFHYLLLEVPEYRFARDYLTGRGLSEKTIKKFQIGVSPKGWNTLLNLMTKRGFSLQELTQSGLVIPKEGSPTQGYDRFRQRLMFPIANLEGAVVGFGARMLIEEENQPKYINSPESPLFSKRKLLYGLHENQRGIRLKGEAVIVEGYMDVVGLYEAGVHNAIATMGTAMTEDHCIQMKSISRRVVTVFDPDSAGADAWHRSVSLFIESGIFAKDLSLPPGQDPDEFVLKEGAEKFHQLCEKAPRQVTKLLKEIAGKGALSEEESARQLSELTPILIASRKLPDRATLWDDVSLVLKVSVAAIRDLVEGATNAPGRIPPKSEERPKSTGGSAWLGPRGNPVPQKSKTHPLDIELFQVCLNSPELFLNFPKDTWQSTVRDKRILRWLEKLHEAPNVAAFEVLVEDLVQNESDPELLALASAQLLQTDSDRPRVNVTPFEAIAERIRGRKKEIEIKALSAQVKLTQRLGNDEEQLRLLTKLKELRSS